MRRFELTLALFKPDIYQRQHHVKEVTSLIVARQFYIVRSKAVKLTRQKAEEFYSTHKDRFFFKRLVDFTSSGPMQSLILARPDAIQEWRKMMGPTQVYRAKVEKPDSLRSRFGLTDTRNAFHGSDSPVSAKREISFFFPDFDFGHWREVEEKQFRLGLTYWDEDSGIHRLQNT
jgi:nucleoside-diphosphate kinase